MGINNIGGFSVVYCEKKKETSIQCIMTSLLSIQFKRENLIRPVALLVIGYVILAIIALKDYLSFQSLNFILGLLALPLTLQVQHLEKRSYRFAWLVLICMILCFRMPVSTLLYFAIWLALFFLIECFYIKIRMLSIFTIALLSPVFQYFINTFSFPIRLELTRIAGILFNAIDREVVVKGNVIIHQGNEFSVDPGCMGLSMMEASLLLGIMLIGFYQQKFQRRLRNWKLLLYLATIAALNIIANLLRIILLVQFSVLPASFSHELAGIICLILYVFLPAVWLASLFIKSSPVLNNGAVKFGNVSRRSIVLHILIFACISLLAVRMSKVDTYNKLYNSSVKQTAGFLVTPYAPGILKLQSPHALIYIKYIRGFYDTDHSPMICWKGSGYVFEQIQKEKVSNQEVYTGTLINGDEKLYSAWWYGNGLSSTVSQFKWRWDMLRGAESYAVINVTCASREELDRQVKKIFQEKILNTFFK